MRAGFSLGLVTKIYSSQMICIRNWPLSNYSDDFVRNWEYEIKMSLLFFARGYPLRTNEKLVTSNKKKVIKTSQYSYLAELFPGVCFRGRSFTHRATLGPVLKFPHAAWKGGKSRWTEANAHNSKKAVKTQSTYNYKEASKLRRVWVLRHSEWLRVECNIS